MHPRFLVRLSTVVESSVGLYRVHSCVHDNKPSSPPLLPPLIRKHASAPLGISLISSPSAPTSACFYTGGSSYVNEPHRCFSVLNERLGFFFVSHLEKCVFVSTKAAYDRLRFVLRRSVVFLRVNHGTMDVVLGT